MTEADVVPEEAAFGGYLRREREMRGLSVEAVSAFTKLSHEQVSALEDGRWTVFPAIVYLRGAVRNYARAVGLDVEAVLLHFEDQFGEQAPAPVATGTGSLLFQKPPRSPARVLRPVVRVLGLALGLFLVVLVAWWLLSYPLPERGQAPVADAPPVLGSEPLRRNAGAPTAATEPAADAPAVPPPPTRRLRVEALDPSWLRVRVDGAEPREFTLAAGRSMVFPATDSIDFYTGNAGGLQLQLDDGPVFSLGVTGQVRRRVFRFGDER